MKRPEQYRREWNDAVARGDAAAVRHVLHRAAMSFLDRCLYNDEYLTDTVELLCEAANADDQASRAGGTEALFGIVVESLCDDFEEFQTIAYNRVMSQVVSHCRAQPGGEGLDRRLHDVGIESEEDLFERAERMRDHGDGWRGKLRRASRILVLSRVTIGADVALTSVLLQRLRTACPDADVVLLGGGNQDAIFGGASDVRVRALSYPRRGGLVARLDTWQTVLDAVREESAAAGPERTVVIDPDSRMSQLGVLPLVDDRRYFFLNSRAPAGAGGSMAALGNRWMDCLLGEDTPAMPCVWLRAEDVAWARDRVDALRAGGAERVVVVNLGVGGNSRKRVGDAFERLLMASLAGLRNTVVVLDRGFGDEERERVTRLLSHVRGLGLPATEDDGSAGALPGRGIVALRMGLGQVAALIAAADRYIGYDSACQHMAAAVGTDCRTVFAGTNNPRFVRRWQPTGPGPIEFVHVDTLTRPRHFDEDDIVARLLSE